MSIDINVIIHDSPFNEPATIVTAAPKVLVPVRIHIGENAAFTPSRRSCFSRCCRQNVVKVAPKVFGIPDSVKNMIFDFLDIPSICSLGKTSRHFRMLSDRAAIWQKLCLKDGFKIAPSQDETWKDLYSVPRNFDVSLDTFRKDYQKNTRIRRCLSPILESGFYLGVPVTTITTCFTLKNKYQDASYVAITLFVSSFFVLMFRIREDDRFSCTVVDLTLQDMPFRQRGCLNEHTASLYGMVHLLQTIPSCLAIAYGFLNVNEDPLPSNLLLAGGVMGLLQGVAPSLEMKEHLIGLVSEKTSSLCLKGSEKVRGCFRRVKRRFCCAAVAACLSRCFARIGKLF